MDDSDTGWVRTVGLELGCTPSATLGMRSLPALVSYAALLQLPTDGLEQVVDRELGENPALERDDPPLPYRAHAPVDPADLVSAGDDDFDRLRGDARLGVPAADRHLVDHVVASFTTTAGSPRTCRRWQRRQTPNRPA